MGSNFEEMISALGYDALYVIFGIDPKIITENQAKKLIKLISLVDNDELFGDQITSLMSTVNNPEILCQLLLSLSDQ
jgi:hypothetical protein